MDMSVVLGFKNGPRPPFNFPGVWLYSGSHPVLHVNDISQRALPLSVRLR